VYICVVEIIPEHCLLEVLLPELLLVEMLLPEVLLMLETKAVFDVATEQLNRQDQNSSSQGFLLKKRPQVEISVHRWLYPSLVEIPAHRLLYRS
jgi:hypothetical protein